MATRCDLNGIKSSLQSLFTSANTTTASPIDLSADMTKRVQKILSVNPEMIPPQASFYPYVTCFVTEKAMESRDITINQLNAKRKATVSMDVVGCVWNQNFVSVDQDPADKDINYLMENIELTLRSNPNISGNVTWQIADGVQYYTVPIDNQTHLRAGILSVKATVFY